jgi:DNA-directed RNA polymerase subunit beta'
MISLDTLSGLRISLASPEHIRNWSSGEVTKPETLHYRTLKPMKDGLFCEQIFGPTKSWTCACGAYKRVRFRGKVCEKCGVAVTHSRVRREHMGHIELATPVSHPWYAKGTPSCIALLLNISPRHLNRILYYTSYMVISIDEDARLDALSHLDEEIASLSQRSDGDACNPHEEDEENLDRLRLARLMQARQELDALQPLDLLEVERYRELARTYGHVLRAGIGAGAVREILADLDLDQLSHDLRAALKIAAPPARKKILRRLHLVEAFRSSHTSPAWMILTVLPVLPAGLRPLLQLENVRMVSADLNSLYAHVINRNNRLKQLMALDAPEIILNNERRKLQDACYALFDNTRQDHPLLGPTKQTLRSLSDTLRGKAGRFRHHLLGKRVDYSGRSVIVVGPQLKMHQCGLPKKMALELFKPFVIGKVLQYGLAPSLRTAKRYVERQMPIVWDLLEEVMQGRLILLNRAPTLHRLSIQAFEPILVEGDAIHLPALVTSAFNADFDGDQMAVHLPLSPAAQQEARSRLLTRRNLLHPATGEPTLSLSQDIVLGCYYLTEERSGGRGEGHAFTNVEEVLLAHQSGWLDLQVPIWVRLPNQIISDPASVQQKARGRVKTTAGRILFNEILPERLRFRNETMTKSLLRHLVAQCHKEYGQARTARLADEIKRLGFIYATKSGTSFAMSDVRVPTRKREVLEETDARITELQELQAIGLITPEEQYQQTVTLWNKATERVTALVRRELDPSGSVARLSHSGATKAGFEQIRQLSGIRGLMASPSGKILAVPVRSNFLEGLSVLEYFISSHGARKGFMDRSLNTAESGYLFLRLINAVQSVIVTQQDCGTQESLLITEAQSRAEGLSDSRSRLIGRMLAKAIPGIDFLPAGSELDEEMVDRLFHAGVQEVAVRSVLGCQARQGVCQACYGHDLSTRSLVRLGVAVGILAAQSIGEPSTQLTMRTFHTGGVAGVSDITQGLPRVEELFEARRPKEAAILSEIDGTVTIVKKNDEYIVHVVSPLMSGVWTSRPQTEEEHMDASTSIFPDGIHDMSSSSHELEVRSYTLPFTRKLVVSHSQQILAGTPLTTGPLDPQEVLRILGKEAVQQYLVSEVRKVYRTTGVYIHEKHFEVIVREMLRHVQIEESGETKLLPGEIVDRLKYADLNAHVLAEGGEPATAKILLLGLTRTALASESWLTAASFQEATRVLTDAVLKGKIDDLQTLKANVMIGRLISAGTGFRLK